MNEFESKFGNKGETQELIPMGPEALGNESLGTYSNNSQRF